MKTPESNGTLRGFCLSFYVVRIFVIVIPLRGIRFDVFPDIVHFAFVADDVFVVIALPDAGGVVCVLNSSRYRHFI